jgi:hypothetical protein
MNGLLRIVCIVTASFAIAGPASAAVPAQWWSIVQNNTTHVCSVMRDHPGWMGGAPVGHFPTFQQAVDGLLPMKRNGVCK